MLLLSYSTGCYSNTLIHADTNVPPIKSIVLILRHFLFQNSVFFICVGATSFSTWAQSNFDVLQFGHKSSLIRCSPKKKFAVKEKSLTHCRQFSDNARRLHMRISALFC